MVRMVVVILLLLSFGTLSSAKQLEQTDTYRVYSDILVSMFGITNNGACFVVYAETVNDVKLTDYSRNLLSGLRGDTAQDYSDQNRTSDMLENRFSESLNVILLSADQYKTVFSDKEVKWYKRWEKFYQLYPKSRGVMRFSKVGFSKDKRQALVYYSYSGDSDSGRGILMLLNWDGHKWGVSKEALIFVA